MIKLPLCACCVENIYESFLSKDLIRFSKLFWFSIGVWIIQYFVFFSHGRHGCISDTSLRGLMQHLRYISKRDDLQFSETAMVRLIKDAFSETSPRSFRSSQRRPWVASEIAILCFQTEACFGHLFIYLHIFKHFAKLI